MLAVPAPERHYISGGSTVVPHRVQRHRTPGYRTPAGVVYVGRPTKWGNPFVLDAYPSSLGETARRKKMVHDYERALRRGDLRVSVEDVRRELAGKSLSCWCPLDQPCHADVLLRIARTVGRRR